MTHEIDPVSAFIVHKQDGTMAEFRMHDCGLHYVDFMPRKKNYTIVETVKANAKKQLEGARKAQEFKPIVGHPSTADLIVIVKTNQIANCLVTVDDINRAEKIYGPSVAY